jgi:hypothetical protein
VHNTIEGDSIAGNKIRASGPTRKADVMSIKHIVIMPDVQAPLHDEVLVDKFIRFLGDYQPSGLGQVGDFTDSTQLGRWVLGQREQYDGNLQRDFDISTDIIRRIREVYDGPFDMSRSNHDDRLMLKIKSHAPELESLRDLTIERQLHLAEYDVTFHHEVVDIAPGWVMCHGDEGGLAQTPGHTAYKLSVQYGMNTVTGHTHRLGIVTSSHGYNGRTVYVRQGMEVGHMMDMGQATYLKGGKANWQQGFGILHITDDGSVFPEAVSVINGCFVVDGKMY